MNLKNCTPVLIVKDAKKSSEFYANVLGFTITADFGGLNYAFKEGFAIWQPMEQNIIPQKLGDAIFDKNSVSRFELGFETEDLDSVYAVLKENDVKFLHEINEEIWGQRTVRFYDLDGHLLEVGEAMHVFILRIYLEENKSVEATAKRTYMQAEAVKQILGL